MTKNRANLGPFEHLKFWCTPILSGAAFTFCFAPYHLWWIAIPALWILFAIHPFGQQRKAFLQGWLFGLGFYGNGVWWIYVSIHEHGNASVLLATFLTALFVACIALFFALQFYLSSKLVNGKANWLLKGLSFSVSWVLFEWIRTWFLTGFPWLFLGNTQISTPLAGWAPILGVYGVSTLFLFSVVAIHLAYKERLSKPAMSLATTSILVWLTGWGLSGIQWTQQAKTPFSVAFVQANIPQAIKWKPENRNKIIENYIQLTNQLWSNDLVIWPETALPLLMNNAKDLLEFLDKRAKDTDTALVMGILSGERLANGRTAIYNSFTGLGESEGLYHKQKLVPFGEYVPLEKLLRGAIEFFDLPMSDMQKGSTEQSLLRYRDTLLMPYICYEVVYPDFVAEYAGDAQILVTVSNDSWFGTSIGPHQHLEIAQMRALENQKYMLRGTNNGITAIIQPDGTIAKRAEQFVEVTMTGEAYLREGSTPFARLGSWPTLVFVFLSIATLWRLQRKEYKSDSNLSSLEQAGSSS